MPKTAKKQQLDPSWEADVALCRSGLYEALALGFRPPSEDVLHRLLAPAQNRALVDLAAVLDHVSEKRQPRLAPAVQALLRGEEGRNLTRLHETYRACFGHTAQSRVPPYETEYGEDTLFQQPQQLSDLAGFYRAFGLRLGEGTPERVDHISCECEFLAFLLRKEAHALEVSDAEMLKQTRRAYRLFLKDHLGRFLPAFVRLLARACPRSFYAALGKLAHTFVALEARRLALTLGPSELRLRPAALDDTCATCGGGDQLIREISGTPV